MFNDEKVTFIVIKRTIIFSLIIIGLMLIGLREPKPYVLGFVFGTSISILGFKLLEKAIEKAVTMESSKAYNYSVSHYFIRYFIYAIVLIIAAKADYLSFLLTVLGLFMIKIVIIISTLYDSFKKNIKKD